MKIVSSQAGVQATLPTLSLPQRHPPKYHVVTKIALAAFSLLAFSLLTVLIRPEELNGQIRPLNTLPSEAMASVVTLASLVAVALKQNTMRMGMKRSICNDPPAVIPSNVTLNYNVTGYLESAISYCAAANPTGTTLQAWYNGITNLLNYRIINSNLVPEVVLNTKLSLQPIGDPVYLAASFYSNGNALLLASYLGQANSTTYSSAIDTFLISPNGALLTKKNYPYPYSPISFYSVSATPAISPSGGETINLFLTNQQSFVNAYPMVWQFPISGAAPAASNLDTLPIYNAYVASTSTVPSGFFAIWSGSSGLGIYASSTARGTKTQISTSAVTSLSCAGLSNGNVVVAWVDPSVSVSYFQIFQPDMTAITQPIQVDHCPFGGGLGTSSYANLIPFRDGFILSQNLRNPPNWGIHNVGYRFSGSGNPILGRFNISGLQPEPWIFANLLPHSGNTILSFWTTGTPATEIFSAIQWVDSPPYLSLPSSQAAFVGHPYSLNLNEVFKDDDIPYGDRIVQFAASGLPSWLTFNSTTGVVSGTPTINDVGTTQFTISAEDTFGEVGIETIVLPVGFPPKASSPVPTLTTAVGSYFYFSVADTFIDPQGGPLTYQIVGSPLPSWLTFQSNALFGTPPLSALGNFHLTLIATNSAGVSSSTPLLIDVFSASGNRLPEPNVPIPNYNEFEGSFSFTIPQQAFIQPGYNLTLTATNGDGTSLTSGLTFEPSTGTFIGNLPPGTYPLMVIANNGIGGTAAQIFTLTIVPDQSPVVVTSLDGLTAFVGSLFQQTIVVQDPNDLPLNITLDFSSDWLNIHNNSMNQVVVAGTPGHGDVFPVRLSLTTIDANGLSTTKKFTINVQGDDWFTYGFKIFGYISAGITIISLSYLVYKNRTLIKEKSLQFGRLTRNLARQIFANQTERNDDQIKIELVSPLPHQAIPMGFPFSMAINTDQIPFLKGADDWVLLGKTRSFGNEITNELPSWIEHRRKKRTIFIEGTPENQDSGTNIIDIYPVRAGRMEKIPYKIILDVTTISNLIERR